MALGQQQGASGDPAEGVPPQVGQSIGDPSAEIGPRTSLQYHLQVAVLQQKDPYVATGPNRSKHVQLESAHHTRLPTGSEEDTITRAQRARGFYTAFQVRISLVVKAVTTFSTTPLRTRRAGVSARR